MQSPIQSYLDKIHRLVGSNDTGELASYIPELTKADPAWFGISMVTMDGIAYSVGDSDQEFTIQSISKPFVYATALADRGVELVCRKVGVEPSGDAFNSISLDPQTGAPFNPMINVGAIATTSLVAGAGPDEQWARIVRSMGDFVGRDVRIDEAVYRSESATGHRNRAIAWMLKNFDIIDGDPMAAVENYFRQCSMLVSCHDLAMMAATLANGGVHPVTGVKALPGEYVERVLSVMTSCGMYDYSGNWLYEIGMPAKSGVGGGIIAVLPGRFGIGIFSPKLDRKGNSVRGIETCKHLSRDMRLHVFTPMGEPSMALGRIYTAADAPSRRQPFPTMSAVLSDLAHRIKYLCLHGYLGVDGVEYVVRKMQGMAEDSDCFILDMHQVDGICDSGARLLTEARIGFEQDGKVLVYSRIQGRQAILGPLDHSIHNGVSGFLSFEDNDLAVEWCENRLLSEYSQGPERANSLADCPLFQGITKELLAKIQGICVEQTFRTGERILSVGEASNGQIFVIVEGHVSILVPLEHGNHQRISSLGAAMSFGEMVLLGQTARSATVHADSEVVCWVLSEAELSQIFETLPQLHIRLLENLANDLAGKLRRATNWISALA